MKRVIDANLNRICEGLRVLEDFLRFNLNDKENIEKLKSIRHFLRHNFSNSMKNFIQSRDSFNDTGKKFSEIETKRGNYQELLQANFFRVEEGLRVLEEFFKLEKELKKHVSKIKGFRFDIYQIEKDVMLLLSKNKINFSKYMVLDLGNIELKDIKKSLLDFYKSGVTAFELRNNLDKPLTFYKKVNDFINASSGLDVNVFIYNSLDLAIATNCTGLCVDKNYLPLDRVREVYTNTIGYLAEDINELKALKDKSADYFLINKKLTKKELIDIRKMLNNSLVAVQIDSVNFSVLE